MNAQDLKDSILQLAIQGKLVEQRKEEGTAKELIEEIRAEKERLIKEKKIKKEKPLAEITEDEVPFEIPESWEWVRLRDLGITQTGNTPSKSNMEYFGDYIPFISPADILNGVINYQNQGLSEKGKEVGRVSEKYSILQVCIGGSIGKCAINTMDVTYNQQINAITPILSNHLYIYYLMDSKFFLQSMKTMATGTATPIINKSSWESLITPFPPLEEQKRIVAKIEELMPYIEKYGVAHSKLEVFNKKFPEDMQKSILQYAIQGKLVEQREEEGTAEELYKQIQKEKEKLIKEKKIKKEKPLAEITKDEVPFEIPESWMWVRIGEIFSLQAGKNITSSDIFDNQSEENKYPCYGGNGLRGYVKTFNRNGKYVLIGRQGALCGNINYAEEKFYATEHAVVVDNFDLTDVMWCGYFLTALNINQYATATAQPGLAVSNIVKILIPLPPLAEQKRIVAKIEEMLAYCTQLVK